MKDALLPSSRFRQEQRRSRWIALFIALACAFLITSISYYIYARTIVHTMSFQVLQYNLFGRPYQVSKDAQEERLTRVPEALRQISKDIDVVTFAEADLADQRQDMLKQFKKQGFGYSTSILNDPDPFTSLLNGGVIIVSKWPIVKEAQHVYRNACHYSDCLAAKGVKYARVVKTEHGVSKVFNVFATHMQAWSTPQGRADRIQQATQMRRFVDEMGIPHHEPLLFAGDFNVDNHTYAEEVANLIHILKAHSPVPTGDVAFTSDPRTNLLVGRDGAASSNKCFQEYVSSWGSPKNNTYYPSMSTRVPCQHNATNIDALVVEGPDGQCFCPCCPLEWLDYVLHAQPPYQQPVSPPSLQSFENKVSPFLSDWTAPASNMKMELIDLSDHFPVLAKFEFEIRQGKGLDNDPMNQHLDGCTSDADCHFNMFRCYCKGPNCYHNGKRTDGSNKSSNDPVNRLCLYEPTKVMCLCGPN